MVGLLLPGHHKREGWQGGIHQGRPRLCPTGAQRLLWHCMSSAGDPECIIQKKTLKIIPDPELTQKSGQVTKNWYQKVFFLMFLVGMQQDLKNDFP